MALKQFKTNKRLWLIVSVALFVPPWFVGTIDKQSEMQAAHLWLMLFNDPLNFGAVVGGIFSCSLIFGIPALVVGWVIQCLIIMVRDSVVVGSRNKTSPEP